MKKINIIIIFILISLFIPIQKTANSPTEKEIVITESSTTVISETTVETLTTDSLEFQDSVGDAKDVLETKIEPDIHRFLVKKNGENLEFKVEFKEGAFQKPFVVFIYIETNALKLQEFKNYASSMSFYGAPSSVNQSVGSVHWRYSPKIYSELHPEALVWFPTDDKSRTKLYLYLPREESVKIPYDFHEDGVSAVVPLKELEKAEEYYCWVFLGRWNPRKHSGYGQATGAYQYVDEIDIIKLAFQKTLTQTLYSTIILTSLKTSFTSIQTTSIIEEKIEESSTIFFTNTIPYIILGGVVVVFLFFLKTRQKKPLKKEMPQDLKHCIFCGEMIPKVAEYCEKCGKKVKFE